jgi:hypothetical protein
MVPLNATSSEIVPRDDAEAWESTGPAPAAARPETAGLTLGLAGFTDPLAHPAAPSAAHTHPIARRCIVRLMIFSFLARSFEPGSVECVMSDERLDDAKMRI